MTKDEIKKLTERIISGIATYQEIQIYNSLFNSFQPTNENEWNDELYGSKEELESEIKKAIWSKAAIKERVIRMKWFKWSVAASIFLALSAASYFIIFKPNPKVTVSKIPPQKQRFKNDFPPGHEGAILTLSNGEKIILDSAGNGIIGKQGGTEVIKVNDQLVYSNKSADSVVVYNTMTTPNGRLFSLLLEDGSRVWLNAASSITYPTTFARSSERKVIITGEAYFEIAHNDKKPFIVQKDDVNIKVLGTHFNVYAYPDENVIKITLLEGSVNVMHAEHNKLILPGQQAQVKASGMIRLVDDVDITDVMAWKNGFFSFQGATIESLMGQISRWYDIQVVSNKKIDDLFYAKIPRNTKLSDVLKALELTGNIYFKVEGRKVTLMP